ncbi:MAG: SemiSWEET transporter [Methylibium sp.]|uniref:SemiSWEET family sugar transporter n=1 Tax=Methylibium sp. TaxID=2067992 RepID=UPI00180DE49A|nr:SemiSWEET transporter [Methylibium sp.]MBA3597687.1 SemiSWEET transporter [Methylibium sp.]
MSLPAVAFSWEWVGYAAALLTTAAFVPQAWLAWRTRDLAGVSLGMYVSFTLGIALWLVYGLALRSWPMVLANGVTLGLALVILSLKWQGCRSGKPPRNGR